MKLYNTEKALQVDNNDQPMLFDNREKIEKRFMTVKQLAETWGISPKTIYGWIYRRLIEPERIGPTGLIRFDSEKIGKIGR